MTWAPSIISLAIIGSPWIYASCFSGVNPKRGRGRSDQENGDSLQKAPACLVHANSFKLLLCHFSAPKWSWTSTVSRARGPPASCGSAPKVHRSDTPFMMPLQHFHWQHFYPTIALAWHNSFVLTWDSHKYAMFAPVLVGSGADAQRYTRTLRLNPASTVA